MIQQRPLEPHWHERLLVELVRTDRAAARFAEEQLDALTPAVALHLLVRALDGETETAERRWALAFAVVVAGLGVVALLVVFAGLHGIVWLFFLLAVGVVVLSISVWGSVQRRRRLWQLVGRMAERADRAECVEPLIALARRPDAVSVLLRLALIRLLPRLDPSRAMRLSIPERLWLRERTGWGGGIRDEALAVAALLVLATAQDRDSLPCARYLVASDPSEHVREAAADFLATVEPRP